MAQNTPTESRLHAQIAAHISWANTADRTARTANARAARDQKSWTLPMAIRSAPSICGRPTSQNSRSNRRRRVARSRNRPQPLRPRKLS
jgi:hypothetical protein